MDKLKLEYVWIDKYKCFENEEFNLSTKYKFHYDKQTHELVVSENKNYIENFFGENIDVTTIVGTNGSGKTTILDAILKLSSVDIRGFNISERIIFVFSNTINNFTVIALNVEVITENNNSAFKFEPHSYKENSRIEEKLSNLLRKLTLYDFRSNSETKLYDNQVDPQIESFFGINIHFDELITQIYFFNNFKPNNYSEYFGPKIPSGFICEITIPYKKIKYMHERVKEHNNISLEAFKKNFFYFDAKQDIKYLTYGSFVFSFLNYYLNKKKELESDIQNLIEETLSIQEKQTDKEKDEIIERLKGSIEEIDGYPFDLYGGLKDFLGYLNIYNDFLKEQQNHNGFNFSLKKYKNKFYVNDFISKYRKIRYEYDFLEFRWNISLSSGELLILNTYSQAYLKSKKIGNSENLLILIDEADMLLHPEWQQKYIKALINFFSIIYENKYIQLIISTHSPIFLSDIPKQNVIYLTENENGKAVVDDNAKHNETFGANIYKLFNDAFFLKEGSIGEFAEEKIKELLKLIDNSANQEKEKIKSMINIIGDQFLKSKIERMFYERLNNRTNNESRLMELEEKKNNIQKEIDNIKRNIKND